MGRRRKRRGRGKADKDTARARAEGGFVPLKGVVLAAPYPERPRAPSVGLASLAGRANAASCPWGGFPELRAARPKVPAAGAVGWSAGRRSSPGSGGPGAEAAKWRRPT
jgi:hypothetical protein